MLFREPLVKFCFQNFAKPFNVPKCILCVMCSGLQPLLSSLNSPWYSRAFPPPQRKSEVPPPHTRWKESVLNHWYPISLLLSLRGFLGFAEFFIKTCKFYIFVWGLFFFPPYPRLSDLLANSVPTLAFCLGLLRHSSQAELLYCWANGGGGMKATSTQIVVTSKSRLSNIKVTCRKGHFQYFKLEE